MQTSEDAILKYKFQFKLDRKFFHQFPSSRSALIHLLLSPVSILQEVKCASQDMELLMFSQTNFKEKSAFTVKKSMIMQLKEKNQGKSNRLMTNMLLGHYVQTPLSKEMPDIGSGILCFL